MKLKQLSDPNCDCEVCATVATRVATCVATKIVEEAISGLTAGYKKSYTVIASNRIDVWPLQDYWEFFLSNSTQPIIIKLPDFTGKPDDFYYEVTIFNNSALGTTLDTIVFPTGGPADIPLGAKTSITIRYLGRDKQWLIEYRDVASV